MRRILPDTQYGTVEQVEKWIKQERDSKLANRFNALRLLMLGYKHQEVARITRQGMLKWVHKWNQSGREGLVNQSGGSISKVTPRVRLAISKLIDVEKRLEGRVVTGKLICGYLKKDIS